MMHWVDFSINSVDVSSCDTAGTFLLSASDMLNWGMRGRNESGSGRWRPGGVWLLHQWRPGGLPAPPGLCVTLGPPHVCILWRVNENTVRITSHRVIQQFNQWNIGSFVLCRRGHGLQMENNFTFYFCFKDMIYYWLAWLVWLTVLNYHV